MARVPPEELERLKEEVSVQRLAEARGIKLHPHGKDLIGLCPFHEDHEPSLVITPTKNLWNCLGACGTGGTVIDWVMKAESVSFRHAVEILREGNLTASTVPIKVLKSIHVRGKLASPVVFDAEEREVMKQVINFYHETLKKSPEGLSYLEKRGLINAEMVDHFKIGYSNRTLGLRLPESNRKEGAAIRERLQKIGIYRDTGREHFAGSIVFPVFDENDLVTEIYGRKTCHKLTPGLPYHMYLPGPHKGVFNLQALKASKDIILCEAIIDALTFWCAGFRNVTTSYGVNGFTSDHLEAFKKYGVERVFIAYDRDQAGDNAAKKLAETLVAEGFECSRILFPHDMDANEYALKTQPASKALDLVIRNAAWIGKGKREFVQVPEVQEEPKEAAKPLQPSASGDEPERVGEEKISEEPQRLETISQPSKETKEIFPLEAEKPPAEPPKPEPARNAPVSTSPEPIAEIKGEEIIICLNDRRWRIRGLSKNMSYDQLKVNILISQGERFHVDTFDLYSARCRAIFVKQACEELRLKEEAIKLDLGKVLLKLEELQDKQIKGTLEPKEKVVVLTEEERAEALAILKAPNLLNRILEDFGKCGIVGEETNKLVGYLAAVSRKLENPLAIIIQSSSAAGKTSLMDGILSFMPDEERVKYSAMTGQSLFYMGETDLKNKILAIVEEAGAERASYALKLLQSEGELTIASTGKDPSTGRLITHEYRVEGPVMIFVTTTNDDIDEELQNRCIVLSVNESREQTRAIHQLQRERRTLEGVIARKEKNKLLKIHQNVQRLLKPVSVVNPYARKLTFLDDRTRSRRDHDKYLNFIETITLLHQYQRPFKTGSENGKPFQYLEVTIEDIEMANRFADEVLGRSLDELPPQSRRLLFFIDQMVMEACQRQNIERSAFRFSRREIREYTGFGNTQIKIHLHRLEELEYLLLHRSNRGQSFVYELAYEGKGKDGKPFLHGLFDIAKLRQKSAYDSSRSGYLPDRSGLESNMSGGGRPVAPSKPGGCRDEKNLGDIQQNSVSRETPKKQPKNIDTAEAEKNTSYSQTRHNHIFYLAAKKEKGNGSKNPLREVI